MRRSIIITACTAAVVAIGLKLYILPVYNEFLHDRYFEGRIEYVHMLGLSRMSKWILAHLPLVAQHVRHHLRKDLRRGPRPTNSSLNTYYDPAVHDKPYRSLKTNFLSTEECAAIRNMLDRNVDYDRDIDFGEGWDSSLVAEFESVSIFKLLGMDNDGEDEEQDDDIYYIDDEFDDEYDYEDEEDDEERGNETIITEEERKVLLSMLNRLQNLVEETFQTKTIMLEHSDITRRFNPIPPGGGILGYLRRLQYLSTGGHGVHSDRCSFGPGYDDIHLDGFNCRQTTDHCCPHRTHSVLLYLNDPDDDILHGGDFYIVDRQDTDVGDPTGRTKEHWIENETEPVFKSKVGLAEHMRHTLRVKPTCGNLMLFASDTRNMHGTYPIQSGVRYAMPMWFSDLSMLEQDDELLEDHLNRIWRRCPQMGGKGESVPFPSAFNKYLDEDGYVGDDCEEMIEAIEDVATRSIRQKKQQRQKKKHPLLSRSVDGSD